MYIKMLNMLKKIECTPKIVSRILIDRRFLTVEAFLVWSTSTPVKAWNRKAKALATSLTFRSPVVLFFGQFTFDIEVDVSGKDEEVLLYRNKHFIVVSVSYRCVRRVPVKFKICDTVIEQRSPVNGYYSAKHYVFISLKPNKIKKPITLC